MPSDTNDEWTAERPGTVLSDARPGVGAETVPGPDAARVELDGLVRSNLAWLRGWVGARLRGARRQDADDLCQEILLRAVRGSDSLRDPRRFSAWLYRIANNVLRDHFRRRATRRREQVVADLDGPVESDGAAERLEADEELRRVLDAVARLPKKYREPMVLRHVEDLSYAEIGEILGITENAVQVRVFRARQRLRDMLSGPG